MEPSKLFGSEELSAGSLMKSSTPGPTDQDAQHESDAERDAGRLPWVLVDIFVSDLCGGRRLVLKVVLDLCETFLGGLEVSLEAGAHRGRLVAQVIFHLAEHRFEVVDERFPVVSQLFLRDRVFHEKVLVTRFVFL